LLHLIYSKVARARRRYYQRRPHLRRRLSAPVISVGNVTVGGSSKTPLAMEIARVLLGMGERPAILSRGYARKVPSDGVVVVSDGRGPLVDVDRAGDEPFMAAGKVPGAAVLVCGSRHTAGRFAESRLGCTVHILDDGFQHFDLLRDVDLLVAPDLDGDLRTLPVGRLREPLDAAGNADALLVEVADSTQTQGGSLEAISLRLGVPLAFGFVRRMTGPSPTQPAFAFAGIARPERFYRDLEKAGWQLVGRRSFRDHHSYSRRDIDALSEAARQAGAGVLVTTEKDSARMRHMGPFDTPVIDVALDISLEPRFAAWLADRLRSARSA